MEQEKRNTAKEKKKNNKGFPYKKGGRNRVKCAVWSRVVGYLRPISNWNEGKTAEFNDRRMFKVKECEDGRS